MKFLNQLSRSIKFNYHHKRDRYSKNKYPSKSIAQNKIISFNTLVSLIKINFKNIATK